MAKRVNIDGDITHFVRRSGDVTDKERQAIIEL
jgi:hypothetical protein